LGIKAPHLGESMRINQYLAKCNLAARRKCEQYVLDGRVSVNGKVITNLYFQVNEDTDIVLVDGKRVKPDQDFVYYILNKPKGVVSAAHSTRDEATVVDLVKVNPSLPEKRVFPVGRLDKESEGMLLLTNDGDFSYMMTHPKFEKEKEYRVLIEGNINDNALDQLRSGISLEGEKYMTLPAKIDVIEKTTQNSLLDVRLREGKNRQIRRMFGEVGYKVVELKRISEGGVSLGNLRSGEFRMLTNKELSKLMDIAKSGENKRKVKN
jgi:23S rRNA pseudouridine2605 synthase